MSSVRVPDIFPSSMNCSIINHIEKSTSNECPIIKSKGFGNICVNDGQCICKYPRKMNGLFIGNSIVPGPFEFKKNDINISCVNENGNGIFATEPETMINAVKIMDAESYPIVDGERYEFLMLDSIVENNLLNDWLESNMNELD